MMRRSIASLLALVVLSVAAVLGATGRVESQRGGTSRRVSPIVYPPAERTIRIDHSIPAHRALRCVRCHEGAGASRRSSDYLGTPERTCRPCHDAQLDRDEPSADRCGTCHIGFEAREPTPLVPSARRRDPRIHFSHAVHVREGMRCLTCHEGITTAATAAGEHLPSMRSCHGCHGDQSSARPPTAPTGCTTCHLSLPDGRMRSRFPEGWLNPPRWLLGMHHDRDFLVRHRWVAADQGQECASCHAESDCADCHDGRVVRRSIHPNDFLTTHPQMARRDEPRCTSCHSTQSFCIECHSRLGIAQISPPDLRSPSRFHPPREVWTDGPVLHGREARRSMQSCTSCHSERDCVSCHGVIGVGAGISPHPAGFAAECGRLLRQNARPCRTCHVDLSAVAGLCTD